MVEVGDTAAAAVDVMVVACGGVVDRKGDCKAALAVDLRLMSGWSKDSTNSHPSLPTLLFSAYFKGC